MSEYPFRKKESRFNLKAIKSIVKDDCKDLYLCGTKLTRIFNSEVDFFRRFEKYLGVDIYDECATIAMIALKSIPSAQLHQGIVKDYDDIVHHAWVEFNFGNEWFVADLSWANPFILEREIYYRAFDVVNTEWICNYNDFWDLPLTKSIYENMQSLDTSEFFECLEYYGKPDYEGKPKFGFQSGVMMKRVPNPEFLCPYEKNGKIVSSEIIKYMINNLEATSPLEEDIDVARQCIDVLNSL